MTDQIATEARAVAAATEESIRIVIEGVLTFGAQATAQTGSQPLEQSSKQPQDPSIQQNGEVA